ncbi:MAG: glutamyl-tRNA reductase [Alphaproteobacteria bacterium]
MSIPNRKRPELVVVGANHRTGSVRLREQMFLDPAAAPAFLAELRATGIDQALVMATCDRVEVQAAAADVEYAFEIIRAALARAARVAPDELTRNTYALTGKDAARHLFAVAASLDSQTVGETEVLGQLKASHQVARTAGTSGPDLEAALQAAYAAAKRVRRETDIGRQPVSMTGAAARVARDLHGELAECKLLLIGDGEMGVLLARHFAAEGVADIVATAPSPTRAEALARDLDCHSAPFADLTAQLARADIVIAATGQRQLIVTPALMRAALKLRRNKPVFLLDASVPGDIDSGVDAIEDAFRYDLGDLERVALQGQAARTSAGEKAWNILDLELDKYLRDRDARDAAPSIAALHDEFEQARQDVLRAAPKADAAEATRLLLGRLLHGPSTALRDLAAADKAEAKQAEHWLRRLFRLGAGDKSKTP